MWLCEEQRPRLKIFPNPVDGLFVNVSLIIMGEYYRGSERMPISILAVDDEQNLLELLITVLGKRGFKVKTAVNGIEALRLLDQETFQLALLDLKMGPVNGVQLLKEIKDRRPIIKVIMMTAYPTSETRTQASANGASAYLTKPVDIQKLVDTINLLAH
jgi:DNA-binding NtrC family response regulator